MTPIPHHSDRFDLIDLRRERSLDDSMRIRAVRHSRGLMLILAVLICAALGSALGYLAATRSGAGDGPTQPAPDAPAVWAVPGPGMSEGERAVERRLSGVALERAESIIESGLSRGESAPGTRPAPPVANEAGERQETPRRESRSHSGRRRPHHDWFDSAGSLDRAVAPVLQLEQYDPYQ